MFVNSKLGCARLARSFERDGLKTTALHGDKSQDERLKALDAFKRGEVDVLVATDVAARGLDIVDLPAVFNFDVPFNAEDYVHRIGRTGRAGASGLAVTLVSRDDARLVGDIEKLIKKKIEIEPLELDDERRRAARRARAARRRRRPAPPTAGVSPTRRAAVRERAAAAPSRDPFFDKPYEASATAADAGLGEQAPPRRSRAALSPNIKPKKKVAALFGGKVAEAEPPASTAQRARQQANTAGTSAGSAASAAARQRGDACRCASSRRAGSGRSSPTARVVGCRCASSALEQRGVAVGRLDHQLGLPRAPRQRLEFADARRARWPASSGR